MLRADNEPAKRMRFLVLRCGSIGRRHIKNRRALRVDDLIAFDPKADQLPAEAPPIAAVALRACIMEKHFTLSRALKVLDGAFSSEPAEFKTMVEGVRIVERALGRVHYGLNPPELKSCMFRRSLFAVEEVKAGEAFTSRNVRSIQPGQGLPTRHLEEILHRTASCDIARGTPLAGDLVGGRMESSAVIRERSTDRAAGSPTGAGIRV